MPQLFVASGATTSGRDYEQLPVDDRLPAELPGRGLDLRQVSGPHEPGAKIAVLFQNDDYGKDLLAGLKRGLPRSKAKVDRRAAVRGDRDRRQSQIAKLKASGANVLAIFATPKFAIQAYVFANKLGWRPLIINNAVSSASNIMTLASEGGTNKAVENSISIVFLKDPTDPSGGTTRR